MFSILILLLVCSCHAAIELSGLTFTSAAISGSITLRASLITPNSTFPTPWRGAVVREEKRKHRMMFLMFFFFFFFLISYFMAVGWISIDMVHLARRTCLDGKLFQLLLQFAVSSRRLALSKCI
jgi:hypothetical protein